MSSVSGLPGSGDPAEVTAAPPDPTSEELRPAEWWRERIRRLIRAEQEYESAQRQVAGSRYSAERRDRLVAWARERVTAIKKELGL